jgi:thiol-disulfide isomerase/thioredoxin
LEETSGEGDFEGGYSSADDPTTLKCGAEDGMLISLGAQNDYSETHHQMLCDWCEKCQAAMSHLQMVNK